MAITGRVAYGRDSGKVVSTPCYYRFVGFSNLTKTDSAGPRGMRDACTAKFGQGARMCTTQESHTSCQQPSNKPAILAWVNPSHINVQYLSQTDEFLAIDAPSGMIESSDLSGENAVAELKRFIKATKNRFDTLPVITLRIFESLTLFLAKCPFDKRIDNTDE